MVAKLPVFVAVAWFGACFSSAMTMAAETDTIRILAGGENYQGPPIMRITADNAVIAEVPVTNALASPVKDLTENSATKSMKAYDFKVPFLNKVEVLKIEFINDAWSGNVATGDRNLWIGSVTAGNSKFASGQLKAAAAGSSRLGSVTILGSNDVIEINKPKGGWSTVEEVKKDPACAGKTILTGYERNQIQPSKQDAKLLKDALAKIRNLARCKITIQVMTSGGAAAAANASVAKSRSEAVAAIVVKAGAAPKRISVAENKDGKRSVAITVSP